MQSLRLKNLIPHLLHRNYNSPNIGSLANKSKELTDIRYKLDPDSFGTNFAETAYAEDVREESFLEKPTLNYTDNKQEYIQIKDLIKKGDTKQALTLIDDHNFHGNINDERYVHNLLLAATARRANLKDTFSLYHKMCKKGFRATPSTYIALFSVCERFKTPESTQKTRYLRERMLDKVDFVANECLYNVMVKVFGRQGDVATAFGLVDEMIAKNVRVSEITLNSLLHSCVADKANGFGRALQIWPKFFALKIRPNIQTFNLLLRIVRDCRVENLVLKSEDLLNILEENKSILNNDLLPKTTENNGLVVLSSDQKLVPLAGFTTPQNRLTLFGGMDGFLGIIKAHQSRPNIKTFSVILDCLSLDLDAEEVVRKELKKRNIKMDIDFFNMLIKRKIWRKEEIEPKKILKEIKNANLSPDITTLRILKITDKMRKKMELTEQKNDPV